MSSLPCRMLPPPAVFCLPSVPTVRGSLDIPASPTHSDDGSSCISVPPSPTLSNHSSVHFQTTLALRENNPTLREPAGLLSPDSPHTHRRKGSDVSAISDVTTSTEVDGPLRPSQELRPVRSNTTSITRVASRSVSRAKGDVPPANGDKGEKPENPAQLALELSNIDPTPFRFRPDDLAMMLDPKRLETLEEIGGVDSLLEGLGTTSDMGLSGSSLGDGRPGAGGGVSHRHDPEKGADTVPAITLTDPQGEKSTDWNSTAAFDASLDDRRRVYGENVLPRRASKSLLSLMFTALKDKVLVLLSVAAVVSLALGFFQDFGTPRTPGEGARVDWVEGVAIMVAIFIVVVVGSVNDWQKERQFQVLNDKKEERGVKVIRGGVEKLVDIKQVVVGDIALMEPGEIIPCDGVFLGGHNVKCDESGATGESDAITKLSYDECLALRGSDHGAHTDCFVVSGSKVLEGVGKYVVVAVGTKSFNGRIMMALRGDADNTPLQLKLNALAELIAKLGSAAGLILFTALLIRFFVQLGTGEPQRTASQKGIAFVNILIISVTLVVVAVPEGLPLAVTLALAFATKRMTAEKLLVRILGSCETMANASVICTDKTGTLTQNAMTVVAGSVGLHAKFVRRLEDNSQRTNANESRKHPEDFSLDQSQLNTALTSQLRKLFNEAIAINSTAFQDTNPETGELVFIGSKTETALLQFAQELQWPDFRTTRDDATVIQMIPFSSDRKAMGVVVKKSNGQFRLYLKGASEILSKKCVSHVVVHRDVSQIQSPSEVIETAELDELARDNITRTTIFYANQMLRTIALCYRDFESWPPRGVSHDEQNEVAYDDLSHDLTLIGIVGIEDPLRPGVSDAVKKCQMAGVAVKMCTGDNVLTARSIATQCGIFSPGGVIMEGPVFRDLSPAEKIEIVPRLQVLARSSPEDKRILVETLKQLGEIVGVTGDGTNDGPALKTANVGFSMGIAGTEVAKEASDIILMDDNFASIVKAIMWGRCVNDAVRKFLQFQISTNITAVIITFVSAVASAQESSVLSAVQLLWINIIMDTFAALALATDPASESLLDRKPDRKTAPLFNVEMYKQILFQSMYQTVVTLIFHFLGHQILGLDNNAPNANVNKNDLTVQTLVFNAFVFAQIFNSINCRRLDRKLNIFEGITRNWYFIIITLIEIGVQILIVFVGSSAFEVTRIGGREWGISLALGVVSIPLGVLVRLLPSEPFEKLFTRFGLLGRPDVLPTTAPNPDNVGWQAITRVRDNLGTFANVRGGRVRSSSFVVKSRTARPSQERPVSLLAMAPTLMMGTIAASHAWTQPPSLANPGSLSDPTNSDPSRSSAALWEGKGQIHPGTDPKDPLYERFGGRQQGQQP
ncbi:Ca-transporting ATPase [Roridomyces roridus]|uniref:Calcium-transporting ATPase n=1 Tax=Roridomyces roridus TaxID=1738132 RepID=A0AAD7CJ60_9AGAR|nr:Ca-transporting ATPase [Roridomyces roridus]